jgi:serine protease AprX
MKKSFLIAILMLAAAVLSGQVEARATVSASTARIDPLLVSYLSNHGLGAKMPVVITYRNQPGSLEFSRLSGLGITKGFALRTLPMVIADMNLVQLNAVKSQPGVVSIWANRVMKTMTNSSRPFIGVPQMMADHDVSSNNHSNPGMPVSGKGIGIGYVDTGIDGTQDDLKFGTKVLQNVIQPLAQGVVSDGGQAVGVGVSISDMIADAGFAPPIYVENVPTSDLESGHGTHGAGCAAGTGQTSGGLYGGVAVGAHLVAVDSGDDKGLPLVAILGAYDYLLVHQYDYNIRVINNSWGSEYAASEMTPDNPINVATRRAHDRNIVVVFAAGNSGDTATAINPYSTMPWTISVAAGEKSGYGSPAGFSSRGIDNGTGTDIAGQPANPDAVPNLRPDIIAPGVHIISVRAHGASPLMTALGLLDGDATNISPALLPYYLTSDGTSFACPHVSGVVALMLEADPTLTPDQVVTILRETANPMPYEERVVGAGYVDVHNAVRRILGLPAVPHPYNLFPPPGGPEIVDVAGDQTGTGAQDVLACDFAYDGGAQQIVYTLSLRDLSQRNTNMSWTISSKFGETAIYVTAAIGETGALIGQYGKIETTAAGTNQQTRIGDPDAVQITGNQIVIRLGVNKLSAPEALGRNVVGTTSTATQVLAQLRAGTTLTPSLLFAADQAAGSDFVVGP